MLERTDALLEGTVALLEGTVAVLEGTVALLEGTDALLKGTDALLEGTDALLEATAALLEGTDALLEGTDTFFEPKKVSRLPRLTTISRYFASNCNKNRYSSWRALRLIGMTNAARRHSPGRNAKKSRRAGVRSNGSRRGHGESWRRPFRGTKSAIDSTERLIATTRRLIDDCETILVEHPMLATQKMQRASGLLCEAVERLDRSIVFMSQTNARLAEAPADADDAPERMIAAMERWIEAARQLTMVSNRFDETFAELADYINSGTAPLDISELHKRRVHPVPVLARHPSPRVLLIENDRICRIHVRRQRSVLATVAEAPRRVSRGRAPPLISTCPL